MAGMMHTRPGALPLPQLLLLDLVAPPILVGFWWLMSRGWAVAIQRGPVSKETKTRQAKLFWAMLCLIYLMFFGGTIYAWLT
jgi:hypothetical protein